MAVAVLITDESQIDELVGWGRMIAASEQANLIVLILQKSSAQKQWIELDADNRGTEESLPALVPKVAEHLYQLEFASAKTATEGSDNEEASDSKPEETDQPTATIRILRDQRPEWALVDEIDSLDIRLLLLPKIAIGKATSEGESWGKSLYREAPCETMQLDCKLISRDQPVRTLVIATGGADDPTAVKRAASIARQSGGSVTAVFFQPNIDPVAKDVGRKILNGIVDNAMGQKAGDVMLKVILANGMRAGINQLDVSQYDLIMCGTRSMRDSVRFLSTSAFRKDNASNTLATVRKPVPLTSRFVNKLREFVEGFIPQLKREQRIELVNRIQSSSKWDFDFGILICLSTLIASLGLIRNSPSVVIGAMLVAPLMTPIVGAGLGLAQSNIQLVRNSLRTVVKGFATAFMLGVVVGFLTQAVITAEMSSRGSPNFLDLIVALVSGIAAAYAMGRPNLLSALPGVAIAAALVPPLASSGMALALGEFHLCYGALLLFCTNIVAIILGTAFTFWTVGVRRNQENSQESWPLWLFLIIVLLTIGLTVMMSYNRTAPVTDFKQAPSNQSNE